MIKSLPLAPDMWLNVGVITEEVEKRMERFAHHPPILIRDSAFGVLPGTAVDDDISGAVYKGKVYLFRDRLADRSDVQKALFHELLHYGVRRFMTRDDYISEMQRLGARDSYLQAEANDWMRTSDGQRVLKEQGRDYAMARGVDEALATLAEPNAGVYLNSSLAQRVVRVVTGWAADLADRLNFPVAAAAIRGYRNQEARQFIRAVFSGLERDDPAVATDLSFPADVAFSRQGSQGEARLFVGKVLSIDNGIVTQKTGRGAADSVCYPLSALDRAPTVGETCEVRFNADGRASMKEAVRKLER